MVVYAFLLSLAYLRYNNYWFLKLHELKNDWNHLCFSSSTTTTTKVSLVKYNTNRKCTLRRLALYIYEGKPNSSWKEALFTFIYFNNIKNLEYVILFIKKFLNNLSTCCEALVIFALVNKEKKSESNHLLLLL